MNPVILAVEKYGKRKITTKDRLFIIDDDNMSYYPLPEDKAIKKELYKQRFHRTYYKSITGIHSCSHYCLQIGENPINATDYSEFYKYVISDINAKHILWIYKHGVWNNDYNIRNNLTVKRIINNYFTNEEKTR